jgi:hypothetical protein
LPIHIKVKDEILQFVQNDMLWAWLVVNGGGCLPGKEKTTVKDEILRCAQNDTASLWRVNHE